MENKNTENDFSKNSENSENDDTLEIVVQKPLEGVKKCRRCGNDRFRRGVYCEPCKTIRVAENKKKFGSKPNRVKAGCIHCGGIRDRPSEKEGKFLYLCNRCYDIRKMAYKEVIKNAKKEYRSTISKKTVKEINDNI